VKLDKDLVRDILLAVEASDEDPRGWIDLSIEGQDKRTLSYHVQLLSEAGFIEAQDLSCMAPMDTSGRLRA
jgi:DNA-binding transcriptional ArsR family regulator